MRAGAHALSLLSVPLNVDVITALDEEPRSLTELRRAAGTPPQTTMRKHLRELTALGVLERRREVDFPGAVAYQLGEAGRDLVSVLFVVHDWLANSPDGPLQPGSPAAKSAIKALIEGWSSTIVRALAARPLSLTELSRLISSLNYPSLERRLAAMRLAGQIAPGPRGNRSRPYVVTTWLRRAIAPLAAGVSWERRFDPVAPPVARLDIESAFLLTVPLVRLPDEVAGTVRLAVETREREGQSDFAGVLAGLDRGRVISCVSRLQGPADAWVSGPIHAWLAAVIDGDADSLELGGDSDLALPILDRLRGALLGRQQTAV